MKSAEILLLNSRENVPTFEYTTDMNQSTCTLQCRCCGWRKTPKRRMLIHSCDRMRGETIDQPLYGAVMFRSPITWTYDGLTKLAFDSAIRAGWLDIHWPMWLRVDWLYTYRNSYRSSTLHNISINEILRDAFCMLLVSSMNSMQLCWHVEWGDSCGSVAQVLTD